MALSLTKYEQETIINYNQEEKLASCYTMDPSLIRKLDKMCEMSSEITEVKSADGSKTYTFPKKWLRVKMPRQLSEETREKLAKRAKANFGGEQ